MKYIFELNHPKHYYQFKYIMQVLQRDGNDVKVLARNKDILLNVLNEENVKYDIFGIHKKSLIDKILNTPKLLLRYFRIVHQWQPDIIISKASFYGTFIAFIMRKKSIIFPDSEIVTITNKYVVPICTKVITPETFGLDYGEKHIRIKGFFENCYLAPSVYIPDSNICQKFALQKPFAILRFVGWNANHDINNQGFSYEQKISLIKAIETYMHVYISSENALPDELQKYALQISSSCIHDVLRQADLYIGDSQTMATEAALLGTPAIRSNSFVGPNDMTNFKILEKKYQLLKNIREFDALLALATNWAITSRKEEWEVKKQQYFATVGDSNAQIIDILENL